MAVIRLEEQGWDGVAMVYDGIVETVSDLEDLEDGTSQNKVYRGARINPVAPGSVMYCLANGTVYVKKTNGDWGEAG